MPGPLEGLRQWTGPGNINLFSTPHVRNPDGSISTIRSMSFRDDTGKEILIPTVEQHGQGILSDEDAINQYRRTGQYLGKFNTPDEATDYAKSLHEGYARGEYDVPLASSKRTVSPQSLRQALQSLIMIKR